MNSVVDKPATGHAADPLDLLMALDAPSDGDVVAVGSPIEGFGWAMSGVAVSKVSVELADRRLCQATIGIERPDLHAGFPAYADARTAGFRFRTILDTPSRGVAQLVVRATAEDGREIVRSVRIRVSDETPQPPSQLESLDEVTLGSDGELYVFGWALAESGIERIGILLDDVDVCEALLNLERKDIGELFPAAPNANQAGFGLRRRLQGQFSGEHTITGHIRERSGQERRLSRAIRVLPEQPTASADERIKIAIDVPPLPPGGKGPTISGNLVVQGWAIARAEVDRVVVRVDGTDVGLAYYGVRREDVAAIFTDWPGALHCGFGMSIPSKALLPGERQIGIVVFDRSGDSSRSEFSVAVEATTAPNAQENIRTLMGGAESLLCRQILEALNWYPRFACVLVVQSSEHGVADARTTLASLENQEYENWQLTVVPEATSDVDALTALLRDDFSSIAQRVRFADDVSTHMAAAASIPGGAEQNEWIGGLKSGDRLGCDALLELAVASGLDPAIDFIYADDRRWDPAIDAMGTWFKPDWSPDLLLSSNYIGRGWFARRALFHRSGITASADEFQRYGDYDLVLQLTHAAQKIGHVPKVLLDSGDGSFIDPAADLAALNAARRSRGIEGEVLPGGAPGVYRLRRAITRAAMVSIVIPTRGTRGLVRECVRSIHRYTADRPYEILCIENIPASDQELKSWLAEHASRLFAADEAFNWSRFNNVAAAGASPESEFLLFLNDDIEVIEAGWLDGLLEHAQREDVGAVGPMLLYADRRIQHGGMFMVDLGRARHAFRFADSKEPGPFGLAQSQRNVLAVTGACLMIRRSVFEGLGGFEEAHRIVNNDLDFCLRCYARGLKVLYTPYARLVHHEMASRSSTEDVYDEAFFKKCWSATHAGGDPYYSRTLSTTTDNFSVESEPVQIVYGGHPLLGKHRVRAILAIKVDHIGDFITALPALRRIKQHFPQAKLYLMTSSANLKLAILEPCIDEIIEFNYFHVRSSLGQRSVSAAELADLESRLASHRFDFAIDLRKHPDSRALLLHVGAKLTAGFDYQGRFPWLDVAIEWDGDAPLRPKRQHISDDLLRLVDATSTSCEMERQTIEPALSAAWAREPVPTLPSEQLFRKPVVCVHAASGNPLRQWPNEYFAELVAMILHEFDVNVTLIGGIDEELVIQSIWKMNCRHPAIYPLAGILPLRHLPHLLSRCALFVGNNSGPQHIAAGLGVPTIGVHSGVVDAVEWAPIGPAAVAVRRNMSCSPCYFSMPEHCPRSLACLMTLRPRDVFDVCRKFLAIRAWGSAR